MKWFQKKQLTMLAQLFWVFFRIGPSTFGGGYAMMPSIEREVVDKKQWMEEKDLVDMVSLAGTAPGGVGVNAAAFVGFRKAGVSGAIAAVVGVTLPTFLIVIILSLFYLFFQDNPKVEAALKGVHSAVTALILLAAYRMAQTSVFDATTTSISIIALLVLLFGNISPLYVIVTGLLAGIILVKGKEWIGLKVRTEKAGMNKQKPELLYLEYYI
ncbi:chromate transporter [Paenibacillus baekrokdamisoli]|uniref:Chromate transporter n=2 Tax=Paenibacillus baekrokdamisoli TaxID=1712516 RepID=A0A3G9JDL3_9BACL|nr:chromate transporter [Paenibacillus baekrokdamisoli]BBH22078.1 chromate transporter [Paenibacillus baekrokdamisoli]